MEMKVAGMRRNKNSDSCRRYTDGNGTVVTGEKETGGRRDREREREQWRKVGRGERERERESNSDGGRWVLSSPPAGSSSRQEGDQPSGRITGCSPPPALIIWTLASLTCSLPRVCQVWWWWVEQVCWWWWAQQVWWW